MSGDTNLLNFIYQNVQMGKTTIPQLIASCEETGCDHKHCRHEDFKAALQSQLDEYEVIGCEASHLLERRGQSPDGLGAMAKISSHVMTEMKTMRDSSVSHMAEMMIQGNTMGETTLLRHLRSHTKSDETGSVCGHRDVDPDVQKLGEKLLHTLRSNTEEMKKFL